VVIEDDYDSEFRFTGRPIEPLHTLDSSGRVVYIGTFSKTMLPTLRLGFCVAPSGLVSPMRKAKYALDWHTAIPMQAALAEFIDRGLFARHLRRMRTIYQTRRELIAMALERDFSPYLQLISSVAGLHLTATMPSGDPGEARAWARRARGVGVGIRALSDFAITPSVTDGLVFGYGMIATDRIDDGLKRLRASLD
jgi:GntR family transcriptional regulator/MocR family aminotransferase